MHGPMERQLIIFFLFIWLVATMVRALVVWALVWAALACRMRAL